jgi:hypothetical protein
MFLFVKIPSGDKRETKICCPKEKKSKYEIRFFSLKFDSETILWLFGGFHGDFG